MLAKYVLNKKKLYKILYKGSSIHFFHILLRFDARAVKSFTYNIICTPALTRTIPHSPWAAQGVRLPRSIYYNPYKIFINTLELQKSFVTHSNSSFVPPEGNNLPPTHLIFYYMFFTMKLHINSLFFKQIISI